MSDATKAIAESLIGHVNNDDLPRIERVLLDVDDPVMWRAVLCHELPLSELLQALLSNDIRLPRLAVFDIVTMSAWHYAAMRGAEGIVSLFLTKSRLPVDVVLETGTTALQLACFAGESDTAAMLIDERRADINRKDKYGWTPLHYSILGGQLSLVELLVSRGVDVDSRDKDGTTAAFRAQAFGRDDIVSFLLAATENADQLLVDDSWASNMPIYARVNHADSARSATSEKVENDYEIPVFTKPDVLESSGKNSVSDVVSGRRVSSGGMANAELSNATGNSFKDLAPKIGRTPQRKKQRSRNDDYEKVDFEYSTITNVLREEFLKFRETKLKSQQTLQKTNDRTKNQDHAGRSKARTEYEEIMPYPTLTEVMESNHETRRLQTKRSVDTAQIWHSPDANTSKSLEKIKQLITPPFLPPRTSNTGITQLNKVETSAKERMLDILRKIEHDSYIMEASFQAVASRLETADDWKKLAYSLPIRSLPSMVEKRIQQVEAGYPRDVRRQTLEMLRQWRSHRGEAATVQTLSIALKNCGLGNLVAAVMAAKRESNA